MIARTREQLRTFLRLDARASKDGISASDVERQEDTVIGALDKLDNRPGIVLADEVGMGKTYEALGIAAAMRHANPRSRIVVITPGPDLNQKWFEEFIRFKEMFDFGSAIVAARDFSQFINLVRKRPIVVAPITMFRSGRGYADQIYLLSLYFYWKGLHGHTANAIMRRFREGDHKRVDVETEKFLGNFTLYPIKKHLRAAFVRGRSSGPAGLDDLYESSGLSAFEGNPDAVSRALYRARFVLTGKLMPMVDLLIVDEAHKLKTPGSLGTQAMRRVFDRKFRKAVFLTATPFQLDVGELGQVFSLFARANKAPLDLEEKVSDLLAAVREYQLKYEAFQQTWTNLDPDLAAQYRSLYDRGLIELESIKDPTLKIVATQVDTLRTLKTETIEPGLRAWMIRSLREDKRVYRSSLPKDIRAQGAEMLPFLIYERFIAELFRRGRQTHKAAAEINMVSSYAAARHGALLSKEDGIPPEAETYRNLLRDILDEVESGSDHPKTSNVIKDALDAAQSNEKTLIFCARIATLEQLHRDLDGIWESHVVKCWRDVYPGEGADQIFDSRDDDGRRQRGRHSLLQVRFHRPHDPLYLLLREPYLRTLDSFSNTFGWEPLADWALRRLAEIVPEANRILLGVRLGKTSAERVDYKVAKRCVEQAAVRLWQSCGDLEPAEFGGIQNLLHPEYVQFGLDLTNDEFEDDSVGNERPRWKISTRVARMVLGRPGSLWEQLSDQLDALSPSPPKSQKLRVRVVEQLARYLTYKQVTFIPDLLAEAKDAGVSVNPVESAGLHEFSCSFWKTGSGEQWIERLRSFFVYFCQRNPEQQFGILDGPVRTGRFARHTADGESRQRLREAFNTPLYPMVLIANEVMQEGLDLHKHCRRIVHHDLAWNPAQIEQRIGRVDRLGSLTSRLRQHNPEATLDILYPVIHGTIDERLFRTVKTREKWLEFLLGAAPSFAEYSFTEDEPSPLPDKLAADLAVNLGPK